MSIATVRRVCARAFDVGESRIRILDVTKAQEALTAEDIRDLVKQKAIIILSAKSPSRAAARKKQSRKEKGRRRGKGSKKGASILHKRVWIEKVRGQRRLLLALKPTLVPGAFRKVYRMVKGNAFKNKHALSTYLRENQLIKTRSGQGA